jgi:hypothetical protein
MLGLARRLRQNTVLGGPFRVPCQELLREATLSLKLLDPQIGEQELTESVVAELATRD